MLNVMKMKLFPYSTNQISIPTNEEHAYNIIFVSENSDFVTTYPKMNIRRQFAKKVTIIPFKIPRVMVLMKDLLPYKKSLGLLPITKPDNTNTFIDTGLFFAKLDLQYGKISYKRPLVLSKIISYLTEAKRFGGNKSILMYHVDMSKNIPDQFIQRRSIILSEIAKVGDGLFPFDNVVLAIERNGSIKYVSIYNKEQKPIESTRILSILKNLIPKETDEIQEPKVLNNAEKQPVVAQEPVSSDDEKDSILRSIQQYQKKKVITS